MRLRLLAPLLALVAAGPAAAADPAITFQTQPVGRILGDARAVVAKLVDEKAVGSINDAIKAKLGDKGFSGLDLGRPVLGYVHLPADPAKAVGVLVVPVTEEKAFLDFFERLTGAAPEKAAGGMYTVPAPDPGVSIGLRFAEGYAYLAAGGKGNGPATVLAADQLVPTAKLLDPAEQSLLATRVYFDRLPKELRTQAREYIDRGKKAAGMLPFPPELMSPVEKGLLEGLALGERWLKLSEGATEATARFTLDAPAAELGVEFTVLPRPGSDLAKLLAERKATTNRFAGVLTKDTAVGFVTRLPFFNKELRDAGTAGLDAALKATGGFGGPTGDLLQEALKGAKRTVATGEFDVAGSFRGPNKDGHFTGVLGVAFEDTKALEKAVKAAIDAEAPPDFQRVVKWNAEKVGGVAIHVIELGKLAGEGGFLGGPEKALGGPDAKVALAFAPKAAYGAVGPDAVAALKALLAAPPAEAPVLTVVLNPARWIKFMTKGEAPPREIEDVSKLFGSEDRPITIVSLAVTGGNDLKVTGRLSLRSVIGFFGARAHSTFEAVDPPPPPKN
ncbi:hypothetical protein [Urbifossiella limnaea]|uniref:DUF3352 domain-containing protein n=1 Tax=Urbifossiella limnaea TaxID=2528023 RepID=A0A517XXR5_9BACT|nr:hypothetical protein [Urbifossiella limnaea]QDU22263.1 hypothetical protein ETAA1_42400 [Urbifossiella limnaea]